MAPSRKRLAALGVAAAIATSCTLTRDDVASCTKNADCRAAFGAGLVCGGSGLCERAPPSPRCTTTFPPDLLTRPASYEGVITIGALMDRSVETQRGREDAIRLATTQVNEEKGLDGRPFGVVFCDVAENAQYDSLKRTDAAVASARYLADVLGVPAIVGPSASGDAIAVFDAVKDQGVLVISPAASSPALTGHDVQTATDEAPGLLWRTAVPDTLQGAAIARHLTTSFPTATSVVVVNEKGPYGTSLAEVFTAAFNGGGRTVETIAYETASQRDAAIVQAAVSTPAFVLFFSSQTADAVAFLNAATALDGYKDIRLFLTDSAANPDLLNGAAGAAALFPRVVGSRPAVPQGPTFELFKTSYSAAFKKDPGALAFVPHAYDATWLVFYGIASSLRQEKAVTGNGIARGLRKISAPGTEIPVTPANWTKIADALGAGTAVNVSGASGSLDYDPVTEETTGLIDVWKISDDGKSIVSTATIDPR
ncbi:MAG: ABC transporter substrate-binding protein [Labilithrix sp.]|nr:ABC transporter substrate-binding protein [Labilithrix sp.]